MHNTRPSAWTWLAAMGLSASLMMVALAADGDLGFKGKEPAAKNAPPVKAGDVKPPAGEDEVKPPEVDLTAPKPPALPEGEDRNQLNKPPGRVKPVAKRPTGKVPLVSKLTDEIGKEARRGWAQTRNWPHDEADYSSREEAALLNRQVIQSLMKRQDNHPAVDAYVRWQLLSFAPDLSEARPPEIRAIITNMPEVSRLPVPPQPRNVLRPDDSGSGGGGFFFSGVQRAFLSDLTPIAGTRAFNPSLSVVNSGGGLNFETPEEIVEKSRGAAYDLVQTRPMIEKLNIPAINYRTALMPLIPTDAGLRLEALFADMKDRIEAGDASYKEACQAFFDEAHRTREDATIPEKTRAALAHQMKQLGGKTTYVLKEIEINKTGDMKVQREAVAFPKRFLDTAIGYLKGPVKAE
jgi:hypothetical protein